MTTITALGLLSPLGLDTEETAAALREGAAAAFPSDTFTRADGSPWLTAEVPPFEIKDYLTPKVFLDRNSALFLAACANALRAGRLDPKTLPYGRVGIAAATVWGGLKTLDLFFADYVNKGPRLVKPLLFPHTYANTAISLAAIEWALTGEHVNFVSDRTAAGQAFCEAAAIVGEERADAMLAGGVEALSQPLLLALAASGTVASGSDAPHMFVPGEPPGAVPAEAAAVLLLESEEAAHRRGVTPLARVLGCATASTPETALRSALANAEIAQNAIGFVVSSANGSAADGRESETTRTVFDQHLPPVVAPLGLCGDLQGATTTFLAACAILMLRDSFLAPIPEQPAVTEIDCVIGSPRPCPQGACAILTTSATQAVAIILTC